MKLTPHEVTPQLLAAWVDFLGRWTWDWFATLTFPRAVHPESADKRFRLWISKINRAIPDQVRWVRALELQRREVIHYHALLGGGGVSELHRLSWMDEWSDVAGWARIERPRSDQAVRRYCGKYTLKGGDVDVGGPDMHDPPVSRWPCDWLPWPVLRKLRRIRDVLTDDEWQQLDRWARSRRAAISGPGWCEPGFPTAPAFAARIRARLLARRSGNGALGGGVAAGSPSGQGGQWELGVVTGGAPAASQASSRAA